MGSSSSTKPILVRNIVLVDANATRKLAHTHLTGLATVDRGRQSKRGILQQQHEQHGHEQQQQHEQQHSEACAHLQDGLDAVLLVRFVDAAATRARAGALGTGHESNQVVTC